MFFNTVCMEVLAMWSTKFWRQRRAARQRSWNGAYPAREERQPSSAAADDRVLGAAAVDVGVSASSRHGGIERVRRRSANIATCLPALSRRSPPTTPMPSTAISSWAPTCWPTTSTRKVRRSRWRSRMGQATARSTWAPTACSPTCRTAASTASTRSPTSSMTARPTPTWQPSASAWPA